MEVYITEIRRMVNYSKSAPKMYGQLHKKMCDELTGYPVADVGLCVFSTNYLNNTGSNRSLSYAWQQFLFTFRTLSSS